MAPCSRAAAQPTRRREPAHDVAGCARQPRGNSCAISLNSCGCWVPARTLTRLEPADSPRNWWCRRYARASLTELAKDDPLVLTSSRTRRGRRAPKAQPRSGRSLERALRTARPRSNARDAADVLRPWPTCRCGGRASCNSPGISDYISRQRAEPDTAHGRGPEASALETAATRRTSSTACTDCSSASGADAAHLREALAACVSLVIAVNTRDKVRVHIHPTNRRGLRIGGGFGRCRPRRPNTCIATALGHARHRLRDRDGFRAESRR